MIIKRIIPNSIKNLYATMKYGEFVRKVKLHILDDESTVNEIIKSNKSVVRFGDGELKWMLNINQNSFQENNEKLNKRLRDIFLQKKGNVLICIPKPIQDIKPYKEKTKIFWKNFVRWYGNKLIPYFDEDYYYGNTNFTRWYMDYMEMSGAETRLKNLKKIWDDREITIIEGNKTKMGVGNDLFSNVKSIQRIIAPNINAFEKYDEIFEEAKKIEKKQLILIALGPTATILAYDLAQIGYQALDVGHVDIEYEWFKMQAKDKVLVPNKFVNEAGGINFLSEKKDEAYNESIISVIE